MDSASLSGNWSWPLSGSLSYLRDTYDQGVAAGDGGFRRRRRQDWLVPLQLEIAFLGFRVLRKAETQASSRKREPRNNFINSPVGQVKLIYQGRLQR